MYGDALIVIRYTSMHTVADVVIIGAGIGGLSAAAFLAKAGRKVVVVERLDKPGGRAQALRRDGYRFDMGPSWYWMPEVHDAWFTALGYQREDFYGLTRISPSYAVYFDNERVRMPADIKEAANIFEDMEQGAGDRLREYLALCERRYRVAMDRFIFRNFNGRLDIVEAATLRYIRLVRPLASYHHEVARLFKDSRLRNMLEYPVVFLGSSPQRVPAVYTLMNWIDFGLGSWYPQGGFANVMASMAQVAERLGAKIYYRHECTAIHAHNGRVQSVEVHHRDEGASRRAIACRDVVVNADYQFAEQHLLPARHRSYSHRYWQRRRLSPGTMNFFIGLDAEVADLDHHTFFFDADWDAHFDAVYRTRRHIANPLFYVHAPTVTDATTAPSGCSALFVLIPLAAGITDTPEIRERYFNMICARINARTGFNLREHIVVRESRSIKDFEHDFHAFRGNAFGLGHTLWQTASMRPRNRSKKVPNLYYCGHYTTPGTGTTMSMISGQLAAKRLIADN